MSPIYRSVLVFTCAALAWQGALSAQEIVLSGTIQAQACIQACGTCCGTHSVTDTSGNVTLQVGNAFVDLEKVADDGKTHQVSGHFYETTGQCSVGACTLFAVESVDAGLTPPARFRSATGKLSIQSVVIDEETNTSYAVTLTEPFSVESVIASDNMKTVTQGGDCAPANTVCAGGTVCVSYFGIAGPAGPEFKTCEIPCTHPGASCPANQSCVTIADGPGQVCALD